jgi:signal transduction histidine kinase
MGSERRLGPVEVLRNLALSLERSAVHEAASGAVRGAAEGLRKEAPELDAQLRTLLQDALTVLGRLAHEAAEREPVDPGDAAQTLAAAAMQGIVDVLEQEWQDGGFPLHSFIERLNRLLDEVAEFAHFRADEIRTPGERAQAMAEGMVKVMTQQLHASVPTLAEDMRTLSEHAGRGLVRGLAAGLREELAATPALAREGKLRRVSREVTGGVLEALKAGLGSPLRTVAGVGGAFMALTLLTVSLRRA